MIYASLLTYLKKNINKKKNLIFFLPVFSQGGAGNSILRLCKNIKYRSYNIFIISIGKNYYKNDFKKLNICIVELEFKKLFFSIKEIQRIIIEIINNNFTNTFLISNIKTDKCKLSIREITRTCNTLGIPTTTGLVGKWERIQVRRILFGK